MGLTIPFGNQPKDTHLYFADSCFAHFPGRAFKVLESNRGEKRWLRQVVQQPLHLVSKNLPLSTDELRKRLKIREGANYFYLPMHCQMDNVILWLHSACLLISES